MGPNLSPLMTPENQIRRGALELTPNRSRAHYERRAVRTAWLGQVARLRPRPMPRRRWDEQARGEADVRLVPPGWQLVEDSRSALRAALATSDPETIRATLHAVETYYDTLRALALVDCPVTAPLSVTSAYLVLTKEVGEANHAAAVAHVEKSPSAWERAGKEAREALAAISGFVTSLAAHDPMRAAQ